MSENVRVFVDIINVLIPIFQEFVFPVLAVWWWAIVLFVLFRMFVDSWLMWRQSLAIKARKYIILEIKLPVEILKPIRAMENVFASMFLVAVDHNTDNLREVWLEGENTFVPPLSFEITSLGGETHFYIRTEIPYRHIVEAALYSQYPEIEIVEAQDYVNSVPQDIPNDKWNLEVREFVLNKPDSYPIKTYPKFETEKESKEEKRIDPIAKLLEGLTNLKDGEQVWFQLLATAPRDGWIDEGKAIRDEKVKRSKPAKKKPMLLEAAEIVLVGVPEKKQEEVKMLPPEMMLTPGEREVVMEVENKIAKPGFTAAIRIMYLGKREAFFKPHLGLPISYLVGFSTGNLNRFALLGRTTSKVKSTLLWFWDDRRSFVRKRRAFRNYKNRMFSFYPEKDCTFILNTEEMATIFHFPSRTTAPAPYISRVESRKGEAPPGLPIE